MTINIPDNPNTLIENTQSDLKKEIPNANPYKKNSFWRALAIAPTLRVFELYQQLKRSLDMAFPDTATGEYAERWGKPVGATKLLPNQASGFIVITGNAGAILNNGASLTKNGKEYTTQSAATVSLQTLTAQSVERVAQTVTVKTASDHNLASGMDVTLAGATPTDYNGTHTITVLDGSTFVYTITTTPVSPASGSITISSYSTLVQIKSVLGGLDKNLESGATLSISNAPNNINTTARVAHNGLTGGTDVESDDAYKERYLQRYRNPRTLFNASAIEAKILEVPEVTKPYVKRCFPSVGQVTAYFTVQETPETPDGIPNGEQVQKVFDHLNDPMTGIIPAHVATTDVLIKAPIPKAINFVVSNLEPNTATMQAAVTENIKQALKDYRRVGVNFPRNTLIAAISNTLDDAGQEVVNFDLTSPGTDVIPVNVGELVVFGNIEFE